MSYEYFSILEYESDADLGQSIQGNLSAQQLFSQYRIIFAQGYLPPLFIVPTSFSVLSYEYSRLTFSSKRSKKAPVKKPANNPNETKQDEILLPEVDLILSQFANSYRAVQFSIKLFKYLTNKANHIQLLIADNPYSQEALQYYKDDPLNVTQLETLLANEETKYRSQIAQVTYLFKTKQPNGTEIQTSLNLTQKNIDSFINLVKSDVDKDWLNKYFLQSKALIIQNARFIEKVYTPEEVVDLPEIKAMLDVLVYSEGTSAGYGTIVKGLVKSAPFNPELVGKTNVIITDFSKHPQILVSVTGTGKNSTAAGRYQFLYKTWRYYGGDTKDFSPRSQDLIAAYALIKRGMIDWLLMGDVKSAFNAGAPEWASLPLSNGKSYHNQPVKSIEELTRVYSQSLSNYRK
jgi:muramidase (phage lysozyme)